MGGVHFGNEQRDVGIHAVIARIADDWIAGAGEVLFREAGDGSIERGENKVAVERGIETLDDEAAGGFGNWRVEMPANGFGVSLAEGALGGGDFGKVKPRVITEHLNEALADHSCGAEDSCFPLFSRLLRLHVLISIVLRWGIHAVPPCCDEIEKPGTDSSEAALESRSERGEAMRVPRAWGLKVLRTQTTISVSAARGSTFSWRT